MIRQFIADLRGNVTVTSIIMLIPLCLCAGSALDYTRLMRNQGQLQNAVDAALLSVANTNPLKRDKKVLEEEIDAFLKSNMPEFNYKRINKLNVSKVGAGGLSVKIEAEFPTSLMKIAGYDKYEYGVNSEIQIREEQQFEIALVLDSTGSMNGPTKMPVLKNVATNFVTDLLDVAQNPGDMKFSIIPFNQYVNVGKAKSYKKWALVPKQKAAYKQWKGCVGSRSYPLNIQDKKFKGKNKVPIVSTSNCPSPITVLTNKKNTLLNGIKSMAPMGVTYIPSGIVWGIRSLSSQQPFTQGKQYSVMKKTGLRKVLILMTDGGNTVSKNKNDQRHESFDIKQSDAWTLKACNEAKQSQIEMYTISFGYMSTTTKQLLENCASGKQNYYDASNAAALKDAFEQIAGGLAGLYLSK